MAGKVTRVLNGEVSSAVERLQWRIQDFFTELSELSGGP